MSETVNEVDSLIIKHLNPNEIIIDKQYTRLTKSGDNYGSVMLKLDVTIKNKNTNGERILNLVAKTLPATEIMREIFKIQTTYTNEMAFYDIIVPNLQKYQKEIGVVPLNCFSKSYGTRKNLLENSDVIDDDAVLLLENLKVKGYVNVDRKTGFDFETTKLVLTDAAQFHASFLALKQQRPEIFKKNVRPYLQNYETEANDSMKNFNLKIFNEIVKEDEECLKLAPKVKFWADVKRNDPREPFSTLIHTDLWTNNTMQIFEDGKAVSNKFVDFQVITYGSPAADVFFILWTSVQKKVLEENLDFLLEFYLKEFNRTLKNHNYIGDLLSHETFLDELRREAGYEFAHSIEFLFILGLSNDENYMFQDPMEVVKQAPQHFKDKLFFMLKECTKRGWLY